MQGYKNHHYYSELYLKANSKPKRNLVQVSAGLTEIFVLHPIRIKNTRDYDLNLFQNIEKKISFKIRL